MNASLRSARSLAPSFGPVGTSYYVAAPIGLRDEKDPTIPTDDPHIAATRIPILAFDDFLHEFRVDPLTTLSTDLLQVLYELRKTRAEVQ